MAEGDVVVHELLISFSPLGLTSPVLQPSLPDLMLSELALLNFEVVAVRVLVRNRAFRGTAERAFVLGLHDFLKN